MTSPAALAPRRNPVLGLSVTIALHGVLAALVLFQLHPTLTKALPEPVPVRLMRDVPPVKPDIKPLAAVTNQIHPPQPVLVAPALPAIRVTEESPLTLAKVERPTAITQPPPVSSPAPPARTDDKELDFQSKLMAHLNSLKRYPADARRQGKSGVVMIRFRIDRQGHVRAYRIEQGSGHEILDEETSRLMQRADPFPAPPESVPGAELEFLVPVQYRLG